MNVFNNIEKKINLIKDIFSEDDSKIIEELKLLISYHHDYFEEIQDNYCKNVDQLKELRTMKAIDEIDFKSQMKELYAYRKAQRPKFSGTHEQEILYDKIKSKEIKNVISYEKSKIVLSYHEYYIIYDIRNMPESYNRELFYYTDNERHSFEVNFRLKQQSILEVKEISSLFIKCIEKKSIEKSRTDLKIIIHSISDEQKVSCLEILNQNIKIYLNENNEINNFIAKNILKLNQPEIQDLALFNFDIILDLEKDFIYSFLLEEIKQFSLS